MRVLGWMTEAASKYWDCVSPIAMVTKTGWIRTERERSQTGKTMHPRRMSECVFEELAGEGSGGSQEKGSDGKRRFNTPLCCVRSQLSQLSAPAQYRPPKAHGRAPQPKEPTEEMWEV